MPRSRRRNAPLPFSRRLVLHRWLLDLFGVERFDRLAEHLRDESLEGLDEDNVHRFHRALCLHLPEERRPGHRHAREARRLGHRRDPALPGRLRVGPGRQRRAHPGDPGPGARLRGRVGTMGLMNVGRGEGVQIIQLFGRGVRLKGCGMSLKRSARAELPDGLERPDCIEPLETLHTARYGKRTATRCLKSERWGSRREKHRRVQQAARLCRPVVLLLFATLVIVLMKFLRAGIFGLVAARLKARGPISRVPPLTAVEL